MDTLSWVALAILIGVVVMLMYGFVALHDVPHRIAKSRNHPHQAAIEAGGWISLFTLHAIWPLLWIWAYAYDPKFGYAGEDTSGKERLKALDDGTSDMKPPATSGLQSGHKSS